MSDSYKHKSGNEKRKDRNKKEADAKKGQTVLTSFLKRPRLEQENETSDQLDSESLSNAESAQDPNSQSNPDPNYLSDLDNEQNSHPAPVSPPSPVSPPPSDYQPTQESQLAQGSQTAPGSQPAPDLQPPPNLDNESHPAPNLSDFSKFHDIGNFQTLSIADDDVEQLIKAGPGNPPNPSNIEADSTGKAFPLAIFSKKLANGETINRDYLHYSQKSKALYCFACRLFHEKISHSTQKSSLASPNGADKEAGYKRFYKMIPAHENSHSHRQCYLQWKNLEKTLKTDVTVDSLLAKDLNEQIKKWRDILQRIVSAVKFLGERGLPFRGHCEKIGDPHNGNFLGILELVSEYDSTLKEHLTKVRQSQEDSKRLQAHYLSNRAQDEFIHLCASRIREAILKELNTAKYYSFMVDGTPDVSCQEQATIVF